MHSQIAVASGGATGSTINEANVKLVSTISFNAATQLQERKTVAIVVITESLARVASSRVFADELASAVAAATDASFIQRLTTSGIPTLAASGTTEASILNDIQLALRAMDLQNSSKLFWILDENTAKVWSTMSGVAFAQLGPLGGRVANADALVNDGLPAGTIVLVDASQIAASASTIELDASNQATVQMDTTPDSPPTGTTVLTPLWQNNLIGLKATRYWGADRLRNNAACMIVNVSYGGSP